MGPISSVSASGYHVSMVRRALPIFWLCMLLTEEARLTKRLFQLAAAATDYSGFTRAKRGAGDDPANRFLDHGNYLAYGLGAVATWVLGLSHGLAVLHGPLDRADGRCVWGRASCFRALGATSGSGTSGCPCPAGRPRSSGSLHRETDGTLSRP